MGEAGVRHVMMGLLADLDILMCVGGIQRVEQIERGLLESYPRAYAMIAEKSML